MKKITSRAFCVSLLAAMLLAPASAIAQDVTPDPVAVQLFDEGRRLASAGHLEEAVAKFEASVRLQRSVGALLNLAECQDRLGHTASAWAAFRGAAAAAKDTHDATRESVASARAAALEPKLLRLAIDVPPGSDVPDLKIQRDDVAVPNAEWGLSIPTDPGRHRIVATAPGRKPWETTIDVKGTAERLSIPALALAPVTARANESHWTTQKTLGLVAGGVGVVGLGIGTFFGLTAIAKNDSANSFCDPARPSQCNQAGVNEGSAASQAATISTIAFAAGGAFILGGVVLFVTSPSHPQDSRAGAATSPAARLQITPGAGSVPSTLTIIGNF